MPTKYPCRIGVDFWMNHQIQIYFKYSDAEGDIDEWVDPMRWLPMPFDLCWLKTHGKTRTGWWTGKDWEGLRLKATENVLYWKKCNEDMTR